MIATVLDHLWQSSLFAGAAALLALALRDYSARIRHWVWVAASLKFLLPFAALTALVRLALMPVETRMAAPALLAMRPAAQPFAAVPLEPDPGIAALLVTAALVTWAIGFLALLSIWLWRWTRLKRIANAAMPLALDMPLPVRMTHEPLEPGLVGLWRPVILLPQGITETLDHAELDAVLAHELCHWRRRDNQMAALHMLVTATFWFHPLVWWIGSRLVEERENACDETVLQDRNPHMYAQCVLKVCRHYLQGAVPCASGMASADLMRRMDAIMASRMVREMDGHRLMLAGLFVTTTLLVPPVAGVLATAPLPASFATPIVAPIAALATRIATALPAAITPTPAPVPQPVRHTRKPQPFVPQPVAMAATPHPVRTIQPAVFKPLLIVLDQLVLPSADADSKTIVCRSAGVRTESRIRPLACASKAQWTDMKAQNLEFAPDGKTILRVASEEEKRLHPPPCISNDTANMKFSLYALPSNCQ